MRRAKLHFVKKSRQFLTKSVLISILFKNVSFFNKTQGVDSFLEKKSSTFHGHLVPNKRFKRHQMHHRTHLVSSKTFSWNKMLRVLLVRACRPAGRKRFCCRPLSSTFGIVSISKSAQRDFWY